ncbi:hypothetical protein IT41_05255 [Paracoccus halophilus]|uniref:Uncharacterized protein n=1 Tax=Paracoccus halophilus TaxID=376733 RepID=A0A099F5X4_9RHOB|nr:hypothetical protein IT41_05255 [Paracoccus halophilus]
MWISAVWRSGVSHWHAICGHGAESLIGWHLAQQIWKDRAAALLDRGECHRPDIAGGRIYGQMWLAILAPALRSMLAGMSQGGKQSRGLLKKPCQTGSGVRPAKRLPTMERKKIIAAAANVLRFMAMAVRRA